MYPDRWRKYWISDTPASTD